MKIIKKRQNPEAWEQWDWVWHFSAYSLLILNIIFTYNGDPGIINFSLFLLLSALLGIWYIPFINMATLRIWDHPKRGALYLVPGWAIWGGLISLTADSLLLIGMFLPLVFSRFPIRWAAGITIFQALALYFLYISLYPTGQWFLILMLILGLLFTSTIMGAFIASIIKQSTDRQRLIDDLTQSRANLMRVEREAGRLTERQRLARDIHDTLAQHFTSIIMHLAAARLGEPASLQTHINQAEQMARDGLAEARRMIWDKKPEQLEGASLVANIEGTAARWSAENSVNVDLAVTGSPQDLDPAMDLALLRISQEALHNIKKHAGAQNVNITLSYMPDALALDVADDGKGFDAARLNGRGFGLTSMRERAEELGGELTIESEPGKGTKIAVLIPLPEMT